MAVENEKQIVENKHEPIITSTEPDVEAGGQKMLKRQLKSRHMQMIAIGGSIGAGLFIGSGSALYKGGPGSLVSLLTTTRNQVYPFMKDNS